MTDEINVIGIAKLVADARRESGFTLAQAAQIMGVTASGVHMWERGKNIPGLSRLGYMAIAYDVPDGRLLGLEPLGWMSLGSMPRRITQARHRARMSIRHAGPVVGASATTVSSWEMGWREPRFSSINQLAAGYGVSVEYLLGFGEDEEAP